MMNKKGTLVLRDIVFMMLMVSAIFIFCGIFVSDMANSYSNSNMSSEWGITETNDIADNLFDDTTTQVTDVGEGLGTGIVSLIGGALTGIGNVLFMVVTAPNTIGGLVGSMLNDMGVSLAVSSIVKLLIIGILWAIVIFSIASAFLQGGKI